MAPRRATKITPDAFYARLAGIVSPSFHDRHVFIGGTGGGSGFALNLAKMGPGLMTLADRDLVEVENVTRTAFGKKDIGAPKVQALAKLIAGANPLVGVLPMHADLTSLNDEQVASLLHGVDLIVAGTDNLAAQATLNRWAIKHRIPAVFIGIHEKARGGVIVWTLPGETPCYRCVVRARFEAAAENGAAAVDLPGARGSIVDVSFIDNVALKLAVAILERNEDSEMGQFFRALGTKRTMVVARTHPEYRWEGGLDLFDFILSDLPNEPKPYKAELQAHAFFALDTLWLPTHRDESCPDCGVREQG